MPPTASAIVAVLQAAPAPTAMSSLIQMVPFLMFVGILVSVVAFVKSLKRRSSSADPTYPSSADLPDKVRDPAIATLLNFFWTGTGHIYIGHPRGVLFAVLFVLCIPIAFSTGFFFVPLLAFWIWGMVSVRRDCAELNQLIRQRQSQRAPSTEAGGRTNIPESAPHVLTNIADELRKLADLRSAGVLSEEEFQHQKSRLLGRN